VFRGPGIASMCRASVPSVLVVADFSNYFCIKVVSTCDGGYECNSNKRPFRLVCILCLKARWLACYEGCFGFRLTVVFPWSNYPPKRRKCRLRLVWYRLFMRPLILDSVLHALFALRGRLIENKTKLAISRNFELSMMGGAAFVDSSVIRISHHFALVF